MSDPNYDDARLFMQQAFAKPQDEKAKQIARWIDHVLAEHAKRASGLARKAPHLDTEELADELMLLQLRAFKDCAAGVLAAGDRAEVPPNA